MFQNNGTYLPNYMVCLYPDHIIYTPLLYQSKKIILQMPDCVHEVFSTERVGVLMKIFRNGGFKGIK